MKICDIAQFYSPLSGGVKRYLRDKQRALAARPGAHHVLIVPSHRDAVTRTATSTLHEVKSPRLIGSASYRLLISRKKILQIVRAEQPEYIGLGRGLVARAGHHHIDTLPELQLQFARDAAGRLAEPGVVGLDQVHKALLSSGQLTPQGIVSTQAG